MKKGHLWKKIVAAILSITLLLPAARVDTLAAPTDSTPTETDPYFANTDPEINSVDTVGNLIKNSLEAETEKEGESNGYDIISLTIEGNSATVEYDTLEDSELVVAIYEEGSEPLKMLASGKANAQKEEHIVEVTISSDTMPEYFTVKAFLMSKISHSPLCNAFTSDLYTQEIQELQSKTTSDYEPDRILNLDEKEDTNYAVYNPDTEVIEEQIGKNKVTDNKDGTYTITNADTSFTGLKKGDVFSYNYEDGTVLVVKISAIQINGTTVVITEDKGADLSDAFDYVKIEETDDGTYATVDDSSLEDGVTYEGEKTINQSRAVDIGGSFSKQFSFELAKEYGNTKLSGNLGLAVNTKVKLYISLNYQYLELKQELPVSFEVTISGNLDKKINLAVFTIAPVPGLYIRFTPSIIFRASGSIEYEAEFTTVIGFSYDNKKGVVSKCATPRMTKSNLSASATLYVGIALVPDVSIVSDAIANATLTAETGIEAQGELNPAVNDSSKKHLCKQCISGTISAKGSASVKANLANMKISANLLKLSKKIADFYYSIDHGNFAFTKCPYNSYKIIVKTLDTQKKPIPNIIISGTNLGTLSTTNGQGEAVFFLSNGSYHLEASGGEYTGNADISISGKSKTVKVNMTKVGPTNGTCGEYLTWELDKNGTLYIRGTGKMDDYPYYYDDNDNPVHDETPWESHSEKIMNVIIERGVTNIGSHAFMNCNNLNNVTLPPTIVSIEDGAFTSCTNLNNIEIPPGVTSIGSGTFSNCSNLSNITLPTTLTRIGSWAFTNCTNLNNIKIPPGVTSIEPGTFDNCSNLSNITISSGVTSIGSGTFEKCTSLDNIIIPKSVINIDENAFSYCTNLNNISIPNSITSIKRRTFMGCTNLDNISIPNSITYIGDEAFRECTNLSSIFIPNKVTDVQYGAFRNCRKLSSIHFSGNMPSIGWGCFEGVTATVYYPSNNSTWSEEKLLDYEGTLTWVASNSGRSTPSVNQEDDKHIDEGTPEKSDTQPERPQQEAKAETANSIPAEYYAPPQPPSPQTAVYTADTQGSYTASAQELVPQSEYLLAVVKDKSAPELLASENLLYIDQKVSDETGTITLPYHSKDGTSGLEIFFGPGEEKTLQEFIAKILTAQPDDIVKAEENAFTTLPAEALNAASKQQVYLELPAGNDTCWVIDGKSIPADTTQDVELEIIRTGKQGGQIPEDVISKIAGNYHVEQLNLPQAFQTLNIDTSLKVKMDSVFAGWKCLAFQYTGDGQNTLTEKTLIQNGEVYINCIQGEHYLLIYGKNGDVNCDENVNMADLMKILYHVSGRSSLDSLEQNLADVNLDNNVNMTDLMKVLYYISGRDTTL